MSYELIEAWYQSELQQQHSQRDDAKVVMGFPLWGESYVRCFLDYTLPSMMAPANRAALEMQHVELVLYVDDAAFAMLSRLVITDLPIYLRIIPDPIMQALYTNPGWKYVLLTAVQKLLLQQAADKNAGFSTVVADLIYSERYFEQLLELGQTHDAIAHQTLIVSRRNGAVDFDLLRQDGVLALSARELGTLGWKHVSGLMRSWLLNDNETFDTAPGTHFILWRGKDFVRMHCPHITPVWLSAARCRAAPQGLGVTLDASAPSYMGLDFYMPQLSDDMCFITFDNSRDAPAGNVPFEIFRDGLRRDFMACMPQFKVPVMVPTLPATDDFLPDDVIEQRFQKLVGLLGV